MGADPQCLFCKIIAGEIPSTQVLKTDVVVAFLDINPVSPGHLLVVPTEHSERLGETGPDVLAAVAREIPRLTAAVLKATGAPACNMIVNDGVEAGQVIPHLHVHLIPRVSDDRLGPRWPHGTYTDLQRDQMCSRIAEALG